MPREPSGLDFTPIGHAALNKDPTPDLVGHMDGLLPDEVRVEKKPSLFPRLGRKTYTSRPARSAAA